MIPLVRECLVCASQKLQKVDELSEYLRQYEVWQCRPRRHKWKEEVPEVIESVEEAGGNSYEPGK